MVWKIWSRLAGLDAARARARALRIPVAATVAAAVGVTADHFTNRDLAPLPNRFQPSLIEYIFDNHKPIPFE